jgi:hypothetical protein
MPSSAIKFEKCAADGVGGQMGAMLPIFAPGDHDQASALFSS